MFTQRHRFTQLVLILTLSVTLGMAGTLTAAESYSITFLGTLGGPMSEAAAMNELGDVVGQSFIADGTTKSWPFVYYNDTDMIVDLRDLLSEADLDLWRWDRFQPKGFNSLR